ncbi:hypothetical protein B0H15DRAFT_818557 [Mycena belliarum]|uniref:Uncharacterized protein n=1 Tax=Mycena belliarum TaxID=1033014 RepID=A0AAD6UFZ6_9AGAR|nr:hypothetical protein B0H15DRAFT_818557 [Mycena belliae]
MPLRLRSVYGGLLSFAGSSLRSAPRSGCTRFRALRPAPCSVPIVSARSTGDSAPAWLPSNAAHATPAANARDVVRAAYAPALFARRILRAQSPLERRRCPAPLWCAAQVLNAANNEINTTDLRTVCSGVEAGRGRAGEHERDSRSTPQPLRSAKLVVGGLGSTIRVRCRGLALGGARDLLSFAGSSLRSAGCTRFRTPPRRIGRSRSSPLAEPERELLRRTPHTQSQPRMRGMSCVRGVRQQPSTGLGPRAACKSASIDVERELRTCAPCPPNPACAVHLLASKSLRAVPLRFAALLESQVSEMMVAVK